MDDKVRDSKIRCAAEIFHLKKHKISSSKGKGNHDCFRSSLSGGFGRTDLISVSQFIGRQWPVSKNNSKE